MAKDSAERIAKNQRDLNFRRRSGQRVENTLEEW